MLIRRRRRLLDNVLQILSIQRRHAISMVRSGTNPFQHARCLLNQRPDTGRQAGGPAGELAAEAQGKTVGKGDHDGCVIRHARELLLALYG